MSFGRRLANRFPEPAELLFFRGKLFAFLETLSDVLGKIAYLQTICIKTQKFSQSRIALLYGCFPPKEKQKIEKAKLKKLKNTEHEVNFKSVHV